MNNFENIKNKNLEELAEWLSKYSQIEYSPWDIWFTKNYCNEEKCPSIKCKIKDTDREVKCAWCEINNGCKFFPGKEEVTQKDIIKSWLISEYIEEE